MTMTGPDRADRAKVILMIVVNVLALFQSYRALLDFASHTAAWPLWSAWMFPLFIDSFLVAGELQLYTTHARTGQGWRPWLFGWLLTLAGLAASVAGNIAHVGPGAAPVVKLAAAVPPLAAAASLGVVLGLVKRRKVRAPREQATSKAGPPAPRTSSQPVPARRSRSASSVYWEDVPGSQEIVTRLQGGEKLSERVVAAMLTESAGHPVTRHQAVLLRRYASNGSAR